MKNLQIRSLEEIPIEPRLNYWSSHAKNQNKMSEHNTFLDFFRRASSLLTKHEIDYVIVGGAVLPYYGNIRTTQDIDIMILTEDVKHSKFVSLVDDFNEENISITYGELSQAFNEGVHVSAFDTKTWLFRLDIKKIEGPLDLSTYKNKRLVTLFGEEVFISSPESLIAVKISPGYQSSTDLEDILYLIETQELDVDLLRKLVKLTNSQSELCAFLTKCESHRCLKLSDQLKCNLDG